LEVLLPSPLSAGEPSLTQIDVWLPLKQIGKNWALTF
jgi:hypothetical protein